MTFDITRIDHQYRGMKLHSVLFQRKQPIERPCKVDSYVYIAGYQGAHKATDSDQELQSWLSWFTTPEFENNAIHMTDKFLVLDNKGYSFQKQLMEAYQNPTTTSDKDEGIEAYLAKTEQARIKMHGTQDQVTDVQIYQDVIEKLREKGITWNPKKTIIVGESYGGLALQRICRSPLAPRLAVYLSAKLNHGLGSNQVPALYHIGTKEQEVYNISAKEFPESFKEITDKIDKYIGTNHSPKTWLEEVNKITENEKDNQNIPYFFDILGHGEHMNTIILNSCCNATAIELALNKIALLLGV